MSSPSGPSWNPSCDQYEKSKAKVLGSLVSGFLMIVFTPCMSKHTVAFMSFSLHNETSQANTEQPEREQARTKRFDRAEQSTADDTHTPHSTKRSQQR